MKKLGIFLVLMFIVTACPAPANSVQRSFEKNNLDFVKLKTVSYKGIMFKIPEEMKKTVYASFALKSGSADYYELTELGIYLSVERFSASDMKNIQYKNDEESQTDLQALQDYYTKQRLKSLNDGQRSEPIDLHSRIGKKGWLQSVEGTDYYGDGNNYLIATQEFKGGFYVFQFVVNMKNMPYLMDDFLRILKSVR